MERQRSPIGEQRLTYDRCYPIGSVIALKCKGTQSLIQPSLDFGVAFRTLGGIRNPICRLLRGSGAISSLIASMIAWIEAPWPFKRRSSSASLPTTFPLVASMSR
jgi:hypothetical protein